MHRLYQYEQLENCKNIQNMKGHQIKKIISGGQTGVDRAALDAAIKFNMPHGGYCPKGRKAEDGKIDDQYQLIETASCEYESRTELNVIHSHGTLILSRGDPIGGTLFTIEMAKKHNKNFLIFSAGSESIDEIVKWIKLNDIKELNIAGPRASQDHEIYSLAFSIIEALILHPELQNIKHDDIKMRS